eukprot:6179166-Pleurochrysis_carterae.AAC.6
MISIAIVAAQAFSPSSTFNSCHRSESKGIPALHDTDAAHSATFAPSRAAALLGLRPFLADLHSCSGRSSPRASIQLCATEQAEAKPVSGMRLSELKSELDERGVAWRGVCFEKAELVAALEKARLAPPSPPAAPSDRATQGTPAADSANGARSVSEEEQIRQEVEKMKMKEMKAELVKRGVNTAGFLEKKEFVSALVDARLAGGPLGGDDDDDDDVVVGETKKMPKKQQEAASPGGMGGMGGMSGGMPGGMGGLGDLLGSLGGMAGGMGGMPGFGGMGGGMPSGMGGMGGMGGMSEMLQKLMGNPKAMALFQKVQSNPKARRAPKTRFLNILPLLPST